MKWQVISEYGREDTTLKHYRLLKFFGAQLFYDGPRACFTFRFAEFSVRYSPAYMQASMRHLTIPIPFMKSDFIVGLMKRSAGRKS